jgi:hypothetical protein
VRFLINTYKAQIWRALGEDCRAIEADRQSLDAAHATNVLNFIMQARLNLLQDQLNTKLDEYSTNELVEIIEQAKSNEEVPIWTHALAIQGHAAWLAGNKEDGLRLIENALSLARNAPDLPTTAEILLLLIRLQINSGPSDKVHGWVEEARAIAEKSHALLLIPLQEFENKSQQADTKVLYKLAQSCLGDKISNNRNEQTGV